MTSVLVTSPSEHSTLGKQDAAVGTQALRSGPGLVPYMLCLSALLISN